MAANLCDLSRETVLAMQESASELGRVAQQLTQQVHSAVPKSFLQDCVVPQVSEGVQQAGQALESKRGELSEQAATRVRSISERLLSVVRHLASSSEGLCAALILDHSRVTRACDAGRKLSAEIATLLRRLLQISGETVERAVEHVKPQLQSLSSRIGVTSPPRSDVI